MTVQKKALILMTSYFHALRKPSFQIYMQEAPLEAEASGSYREDSKL